MYTLGRTSRNRSVNIWPGFVDGLSTLVMVVIFVLMVFMIAQYYLSVALSGRDQQLSKANRDLGEANQLLILERNANADLRINIAQLSSELQTSLEARDDLQTQLRSLTDKRDQLNAELAAASQARDRLASQLAALQKQDKGQEGDLAKALETGDALRNQLQQVQSVNDEQARNLKQAYSTIQADKEKIEAQLAELATLKDLRDELDSELAKRQKALEALAEQSKGLKEKLDSSELDKQKLASQLEIIEKRLSTSEDFALEQQSLSEEARRQVSLLNAQLASLRRRLGELNALLEDSEHKNETQQAQILDLGKRLNAALATKVQELARYRSEFFGRLREILGDNQNIRIVGDRFVFQAEVLFPTGSATLEPEGRTQIAELAGLLREVAAKIPSDIDWVLRVDGHTDIRPISTPEFPSNWELSSARAIAVVKVLIDEGIPPNRLVAAGFGQYQPIDTGNSEEAFRRNRRIEFKLTER
ncbi:chemotaxis protein MotB [Tistlia consotensis]|uniref:Chemotaxis protein MotB n=1 Tax=Tistlia consotensis USBA 355 TaxID=560819 RepID=A0A1Y6C2C2_9PROT|nr:peptidoglycan -binding protein [Tistlia consotensis]SMF33009.1 chemotaxis protein MotB [Tistlia consotensis USBA 355]SNR69175.1 chemotaxis protein MotB [Tistlia consotensis]